jgi:tetratricopeptide (TPR) repeat protein
MGVVFKARQAKLDRDVAVKFLRDVHIGDSRQHERFMQEARAVARLQHPHLVQLYEFGEAASAGGTESRPYLVLEYVSGGSLASLLRGSRLPPREAARLVETLAEAIHYAHQQGVVHRDLKPGNVLLAPNPRCEPQSPGQTPRTDAALAATEVKDESRWGRSTSEPQAGLTVSLADFSPKVTDFGLAKFLTGSNLTQTGVVLGTPSYMAPEQTLGKFGFITPAVDVYGLGAILYEALSGLAPFSADTVEETVRLVREVDPLPPRRLQPGVPRDLETICLKCLRKEAGRRYATAKALADDLRRYRNGEPIHARPVRTAERLFGWCRRKPLAAGLVAALALVLVVGLAGMLWQGRLLRQKHDEAEQSKANLKREQDVARQEKERADRNLGKLGESVDRLAKLGRDLWQQPRMHQAALSLLEEALDTYQDLLPEGSKDPRLRREAARMYGEVANVYHSVGRWGQAVEAYRRQVDLLASLQAEEQDNKELGRQTANSHRARGNVLRDLGDVEQARAAYGRAAELQEQFLDQSPNDPGEQVALANTLLNLASLTSSWDRLEDLEGLYRRLVKLDRAALDHAPENLGYQSELALGLENQGRFFLASGRGQQASASVSEALAIYRNLLSSGRMKGYIERYAANAYTTQGRILAAAGQAAEAERSFQEAIQLLEPLVKETPTYPFHRMDLAEALSRLAVFFKDTNRLHESEAARRQAIGHYETLKTRFPQKRRLLVANYLELASLLWASGRQCEAVEPYRQAFEVDPEDPAVNNELAWFLATSPEPRFRDADRAVRLAKKAVDSRQKSGNYWNTLGVACYRNGDDKAAITALEKAISLRPEADSFDYFFLAMAYWRLGDRDKAQTCFGRAVQWMDKHKPHDDELRRFRAEAEAMLAEAGKR